MPDMKKSTISVELTPSQCIVLKNFIEDEIFPVIRNEQGINSFIWLSDLMSAHNVLKKAVTEHAENS